MTTTIAAPARTRSVAAPVAAALYVVISTALFAASFIACGHRLVYPLDDPYIAMAIAKNLATHHVWGITRFGFTPASSSPLFTVVLAAFYWVIGVNQWIQLVVSWAFALACIPVAAKLIDRYAIEHRTTVLIAFVIATPLFGLGLIGMENSLHLFLVLVFLLWLDAAPWKLVIVSALMVGARYESGSLVVAACAIYFLRRDGRRLAAVFGGSLLATAAYGAYSITQGGALLPDSVLLKGSGDAIQARIGTIVANIFIFGPHVALLVVALACGAIAMRHNRKVSEAAALISFAGLCQLFAGRFDSLFRYEAYVLGPGVLIAAAVLEQKRSRLLMILTYACAAFIAFFSVKAFNLPFDAQAIYDQQYQTAGFLHEYFPEATIAANDVGAISFFTDIHCVDLVGLADHAVFEAKKSGRYTTQFLAHHAADRDVEVAIVYDRWFNGDERGFWQGPRIPSAWQRVATLTTPNPTGNLGGREVSFYAIQPSEAARLRTALGRYRFPQADHLQLD